jgi:hypothetical protein
MGEEERMEEEWVGCYIKDKGASLIGVICNVPALKMEG